MAVTFGVLPTTRAIWLPSIAALSGVLGAWMGVRESSMYIGLDSKGVVGVSYPSWAIW